MGSLLPPVIIEGITSPTVNQNATAACTSSSSSSTSSSSNNGNVSSFTSSNLPVYPNTAVAAAMAAAQQAGDHSWLQHGAPSPQQQQNLDGQQLGLNPVTSLDGDSAATAGLQFVVPHQHFAVTHKPDQPNNSVTLQNMQNSHLQAAVAAYVASSQAPTHPTTGLHPSSMPAASAMFPHQHLQMAQIHMPHGMLQIKTNMPHMAQIGPIHTQQVSQPMQGVAPVPVAPSDVHSSQRAAQLARYRHKRNVRLQALAQGDKKIRYQCRKTLADARPRVKGRFAKVHADGLESEGSSPKASKTKESKCKLMKTVMSAVDLTAMDLMVNKPKMEDLDELNPMWWLNDSADDNEKSTSNTSNASLLDSFPSDDVRRCYSENNLLQLDSFDVQSAMEVFQTESNFNAICSGFHGNQCS